MKRLAFCMTLTLLLMASCRPSARRTAGASAHQFVNETVVKTTPVKNQGRSSLCWLYAMFATIESEHLMQGDSVNLSVDYPVRLMLRDGARRYLLSRDAADLTTRGMSSRALGLLRTYGAMPYDSYHSLRPVSHDMLARKVMRQARASVSLRQLDRHLEGLLDESIGYLPRKVFMLGAEYTPLEFAHSVCLPGEYLSLTSFSHHPFGKRFVLELRDNVSRDSFLNVPIDTLMRHAVQALRRGHPVCWEGDISEPGFDFSEGVAVLSSGAAALPFAAAAPDQRRRQRDFEARRTTDDHAMELCGLARDRHGRRYFIAKNSWGTANPYGGFMYLSYDYVRLKTVALYMSHAAWNAR